jgi:predicted ATPase
MHFERGRDYRRAVHHLERAAERSARLVAHREAIIHLRTALDLLDRLPAAERDPGQELRLQMALGLHLQIGQGYASPGADRAYARARELCGRVPESPGLAPVLWGLWMFAAVRADNRTALEVAEQLQRLARQVRDPAVLLHARAAVGITRLFLGDLNDSRRNLERAIALYDPREHGGLALLYAQDPRSTCLAQLANTLWLLGYPDRAARASREAVSLARDLGHPHSLALALYFSAVLHQRLRDPEATRERAVALAAVAAEHGFDLWAAGAAVLRGWVATQGGDLAAGIEAMRRGLANWRATGAAVNQTYYLVLLAEVLGEARRTGEALSTLAEVGNLLRETDERYYEAELYRLRGECFRLQASHDPESRHRGRKPKAPDRQRLATWSASEDCFRTAIAVATRQGAKALELRATLGLIRLDRERGNAAASLESLRGIYGRFDEGFGTRDLDEAEAVLGAMPNG